MIIFSFVYLGIPICGACHKPIEERIVIALGKKWHVDHFVSSQYIYDL